MAKQPTLDDDTEIPLLRVDQDKINEFARLNNQRTRLQEEYQKLKVEMEGMQDAENELMLQDDEEATRIRIGECFFAMTSDDAQESLEKMQVEKRKEQENKASSIEAIDKRMKELKVQLYAKFGNTINLEAD
eukprot:gene3897-8393_t